MSPRKRKAVVAGIFYLITSADLELWQYTLKQYATCKSQVEEVRTKLGRLLM